jgi:pyruvate/2-oxoglutarate dehydrogenase complex dihydrolipoamide acyltransferase (E2) component
MNLKLVRRRNLSPFRRIAIGTWRTSYDPSVYGTIELRMDRALEYVSAFRARTGKRVTVTQLVAKAVAMALRETPDANSILRWNQLYVRQSVGIFFQVALVDGGSESVDLSGFVMREVDTKSLSQICDEFQEQVHLVRTRKHAPMERARRTLGLVPNLLLHWALRISAFFAYTLNLDMSAFGVPQDAFGSVMITNIGSLGLDIAYPPLVAYSRVPILVATGAVKDAAVVESGVVVAGKIMRVSVTFDHRFIDGVHAANMSKTLHAWMEHPFEHFDPLKTEPHQPTGKGAGEDPR